MSVLCIYKEEAKYLIIRSSYLFLLLPLTFQLAILPIHLSLSFYVHQVPCTQMLYKFFANPPFFLTPSSLSLSLSHTISRFFRIQNFLEPHFIAIPFCLSLSPLEQSSLKPLIVNSRNNKTPSPSPSHSLKAQRWNHHHHHHHHLPSQSLQESWGPISTPTHTKKIQTPH